MIKRFIWNERGCMYGGSLRIEILFIVALSICAAGFAEASVDLAPGSGISVSVILDPHSHVTPRPNETFVIYGNVTYTNPTTSDITVDLFVNAGNWSAEVIPFRMTCPGESGKRPFQVRVRVTPGSSFGQMISVNGTWRCGETSGEVKPDFLHALHLDQIPDGHDSSPPTLLIIGTIAAGIGAGLAAAVYTLSSQPLKYRLSLAAFAPFYTRLKRDEILKHRIRMDLLRAIEENPGLHLGHLADSISGSRGTVMYHLRVLEREGIIKSEKDGRFRRFYPTGMPIGRNDLALNRTDEKILDIIKRSPGVSLRDISSLLGLSKQIVSYHVARLEMSGRLWLERDGRRKKCFARET